MAAVNTTGQRSQFPEQQTLYHNQHHPARQPDEDLAQQPVTNELAGTLSSSSSPTSEFKVISYQL